MPLLLLLLSLLLLLLAFSQNLPSWLLLLQETNPQDSTHKASSSRRRLKPAPA
jgi:hypothetical protein